MFNRENLTIIGNSLKNGTVPSLYAYFNEDNDTVTTADFFNDRRLRVGDQIEVISADYSTVKFYVVSAVTTLAGTATVVASDLAMDLVLDDVICDSITSTGLIKTSGKIETTSTAADSIKTAGGGQFGGAISGATNITASGKIETTNTSADAVYSKGGVKADGDMTATGGYFYGARPISVTSGSQQNLLRSNSCLFVVCDNSNGGTAVCLYQNASTPVIISQSGVTKWTTSSPGGTEIQLLNRTGNNGVDFIPGSSRTSISIIVTVLGRN